MTSGLSSAGLSGLSKGANAAQCETGAVRQDSASALNVVAALDKAHARKSDGPNSHKAAQSVVNLGRTREAILTLLRRLGPMTDEQIMFRYTWDIREPQVSPSGLRSRRSELVAMGFVHEVGTGKTKSGRPCAIWALKERKA